MISKRVFRITAMMLLAAIMLACDFSSWGAPEPAEDTGGQNLEATAQQVANQMVQTSQAELLSRPPTLTPQLAAVLPTNTPQPSATPEPPAEPAPPAELIQDLRINRNAFYCVKADGPTTVTFTVEMSDIDRGMAIFWRLYEKATGTMTDWKNVSMVRQTSTARTFTFDANAWDGTNNFLYPPGYGESWFQFQLISGDGQYRTSVYRDDITFFPCAQ